MFAKVAVAALALPLFAQSVLAGPCVRHYTVQEGDICDGISAANQVSTYQLAKINEGYIDSTCSNLQPGATICIGYENEDCSKTYVVKAQDSCGTIADAHAINTTMLYLNNPQIDGECSNIYVGETRTAVFLIHNRCQARIYPPTTTVAHAYACLRFASVPSYLPPPPFSKHFLVLCVNDVVAVPPHSGVETIATAIPVTATAAASAIPTTSSSRAAVSSSASASASASSSSGDDEDDEDLPFCDEL
ncbi:hypothetical protein K435DRAFT_966527 [Dendrothele bispora CBS 962.96]|uniref:LysM domain-containing protein n=1 Tax=Dendrothele bispora (strain CBS 962.96) TaxID=1314807 RepID=A0A4S8KT29_DENBC|nr:hypothetical protein K435DRAFT_973309 [Dendrothele bispora CBS 962.96]THU95302.1 hypothetical protein K435DRAFT_966527 [Dendrothele bispora CBS 962.96]